MKIECIKKYICLPQKNKNKMDRKCKFNRPVKSTLTDKHYNDQQLKRTPTAHIHKTKQHVKCASPLARQGNLC